MVKRGKQNELVGKIILANFLEYSLLKFLKYIKTVENQPIYKKLVNEGVVIRRPFSVDNFQSDDGVIAQIKKEINNNFSIQYSREEFSIEYLVNSEKLLKAEKLPEEQKENIGNLVHKLRRISTRNHTMYKILKGIIECQRDYFESDNENEMNLKLKTLQLKILAKNISDNDFLIDASRISRISKGISLINHKGKLVSLKEFFSTKRDIVKKHIKAITKKEKEEFCDGWISRPYTDGELQYKLEEKYNLFVSRREVGYCRNDMGILPYSKRINGYGYSPLSVNFSAIYPFTASSVKKNVPVQSGVYELRLDGKAIDYPRGHYQAFYIGSAKNLRKRLIDHLGSNGKNNGIKEYIKKEKCVFRYVQFTKGWGLEEKNLYMLFIKAFGDSPVCNHLSP